LETAYSQQNRYMQGSRSGRKRYIYNRTMEHKINIRPKSTWYS